MKSLRSLYDQLARSTGFKQSMLMLVGNTFSAGVSALSLIIISRTLGPEKFGEFSVGFAIALMLIRLNDLGLSYAIQKFAPVSSTHDQVNRIFSFTLRTKLIANVAIVLIGLLVYQRLAEWINFPNTNIVLGAFLLYSATVFFEQLQAMLQSLHRFVQSVGVNLIQATTKLVGISVMWLLGWRDTGAMFTLYLLAPITPVLVFQKFLPSWTKMKIMGENFASEQSLLKAMASHSAIAFISAGVIENIDVLFVQQSLSTYDAGLYGGAARIALLLSIAAYSLANVLNPRVSKYQQKSHLRQYLKKASLIAVAAVAGYLLYLPLSSLVLHLTIGPAYAAGLGVLNILMAASFLTIAVVPFVALFFSFDAPWYFSVSGLLQLIIIIGGNLIFIPLYGLEAAAWIRLLSRLVLFFFTVALAWYFYQKKDEHHHEQIAPVVE